MADIKFTQTLKMHLNGGSKFSALVYNILADGKPTGIVRTKRTSGSPKYLLTEDVFVYTANINGTIITEEFNNLPHREKELEEWLIERTKEATGNVSSST